MFFNYFVAVILFVCVADCAVDDYRFVSEINGFLKLHRVAAKWRDARLKCHLEGGVLASPTDKDMLATMKEILIKNTQTGLLYVYTGIHATYSDGDFTTIDGTPLTQIDVQWGPNEPDGYGGEQNCIVMFQSGEIGDVNCSIVYPYFCFKSMDKIDDHNCGPEYNNSDYKLDHRTGSCYKFHTEGSTWPNAFRTCLAENAHLAIINSKLESDVLKELFNKYPHHAIPGDFHKDAASIGFTMWKEAGDWYTIHGESLAEAGFTTFNAGEPNNADKNEWCGSVWRTGLMNDHNCNRILTFICEKKHEEVNNQ